MADPIVPQEKCGVFDADCYKRNSESRQKAYEESPEGKKQIQQIQENLNKSDGKVGQNEEDKLKEQEQLNEERSLNIQCFLVDNMEDIVSRRMDDTYSDGSNYKTFIMANGGAGDICQEILGRKGIEKLFNLTSAQKALLIPKVKIYKIVYDDKNPKTGKDIPLYFKDHLTLQEVSSMQKGRKGRGDDVGLKAFTYTLDGTQPAEGAMIKCSLSLFFQNASSFLEKRDNGVSFQDLIWDKNLISKTGETYNPKNFRIKIVAGWAIPSDPKGILFSQDIIKAIERTNTILYLTHTDHDLEFNEDGSLQVTINFSGAIEGFINDVERANIFKKTPQGLEAEGRKRKLQDQEKAEKNANGESKIDNSPQKVKKVECKTKIQVEKGYTKYTDCTETETTIPNSKEIERANIMELEALDRQEKYARIIRELYDNSQMYVVDIDRSMIDSFTQGEKDRIKERLESQGKKVNEKDIKRSETEERAAIREGAKSSLKIKDKIKRVLTEEDAKRAEQLKANVENAIKESYSGDATFSKDFKATFKGKDEKEKGKLRTNALTISPRSSKENTEDTRVHFFYFGDLLDILFGNYLINREDVDSPRVILGSLVYKDPRTGQQKEVNLADVPISLERFMAWYSKKVIATQREVYTVGNFIRDILNEVIIGALGENCFGKVGLDFPQIRFDIFSISGLTKKEPLFWVQNGKRYPFNDLKVKPNLDILEKSKNIVPTNLFHYLFIYASNYTIKNSKGLYYEDVPRGIYHLAPGLDRGLVKSIKFTKDAIPHGPEMTLEAQSKGGINSPNVYNANVRMVGNNFFKNGVFIYIDTSKMGMGDAMADKLSQEYHIGGYYHIEKVSHDFITNGDYETVLSARWHNAKAGDATGFSIQGNENKCMTPAKDWFFKDTKPNFGMSMNNPKPEQSITKKQ